jgi:hypothetical protein
MPKVRSLEFWLIALPLLFVLSGFLAGFDHVVVAKYFLPLCAATWMLLAIAWMFREFVRRIRN